MNNQHGQICRDLCLILLLWLAATGAPASAQELPAADAPVLTLRVDDPGPKISRDIFGQFAEMLGEGIYGGVWVGPRRSPMSGASARMSPRR